MKSKNYEQLFQYIYECDTMNIHELALKASDPYLRFAAQIYITAFRSNYPYFTTKTTYVVKRSFYFPEWKIILLYTIPKSKYVLYFIKEKLIYRLVVGESSRYESTVLKYIKFSEKARLFKNEN